MGISFHRGPLGNLEWGSYTRDFERWVEALGIESFSLKGLSMEGFWRGLLY